MSWCYQQKKKEMYIDGHKQEDVVEYWKGFVECWKEYKGVLSFTEMKERLSQHLPDSLFLRDCGFVSFL